MKDSMLYYSVGALLYCPANNKSIADSIISEKFGKTYSLALCLEDTINDNCIAEAESILIESLTKLYQATLSADFFMPKIFIRIRNEKQMKDLFGRLGDAAKILCGFILPKFDLTNADAYIHTVLQMNEVSERPIYVMPILESPAIIDLRHRMNILYTLKEKLSSIEKYVLNIRVGGNDLCHAFGFRRHNDESIHSIPAISNIFSDIITVFGMDYVISGPVWEYYNGDNWDAGLINELSEDRLCGFVGKTVIHPNQIPLIHQAYAVTAEDLADAKAILGWDTDNISFVSGNTSKQRMNEYKTHSNWAQKILYLSEVYGIQ